MGSDCIFCMIAAGQLDARVVYEDERVVAFDDITPQAPVHVLIVPRTHHADLGDEVGSEFAAALLAAVPLVAQAKGIDGSGYRVVINNGADAGQTVGHLHLHVMGGARMSHGMVTLA